MIPFGPGSQIIKIAVFLFCRQSQKTFQSLAWGNSTWSQKHGCQIPRRCDIFVQWSAPQRILRLRKHLAGTENVEDYRGPEGGFCRAHRYPGNMSSLSFQFILYILLLSLAMFAKSGGGSSLGQYMHVEVIFYSKFYWLKLINSHYRHSHTHYYYIKHYSWKILQFLLN